MTCTSTPYRNAAAREAESRRLHKGPRMQCPACGMKATTDPVGKVVGIKLSWMPHETPNGPTLPRACSQSWWRRLFWKGCQEKLSHLHQSCWTCSSRWVVAPLLDPASWSVDPSQGDDTTESWKP